MLFLKIKKSILVFISLFCLAMNSTAQYSEVGIMVGASNYKGELSPHLFNTDFNHFAIGGFYRHNWNRHWSYKLEFNYGKISGDDAKSSDAFERNRNLSFFSDILEVSPLLEFNFFPYETNNSEYPFTPYLFTGISIFHFNPKAELDGNIYELSKIGTEGQAEPYPLITFALPIGGGIKFSMGNVGVGIEVGARRTYTDYLDDVSTVYPDLLKLLAAKGPVAVALSDRSLFHSDSTVTFPKYSGKQRGNSKDNDWYVFAGVTIFVRLNGPAGDNCSPFRRRRY